MWMFITNIIILWFYTGENNASKIVFVNEVTENEQKT